MSEIDFTTLEVENYSCIESAVIPLNTAEKCLIQGEKLIKGEEKDELNSNRDRSNGTGKTSLVEAFYWCITGEFFDPGTTMSTVLNRFTKGDTVVRLKGFKDSIPFEIERSLTAKSKRVGAKVTHIINFTVDGEKIQDKTSSLGQIQEAINSFLGTNPLLLLNSRIIGQGEISSFTKVNDRQKKILIDNLVGVGICDKYLAASKKLYSEVCTAITAVDVELNSLQATVTRLERDRNNFLNKHTEWEDEQNRLISAATNKIADLDRKLKLLNETISMDEAAVKEFSERMSEFAESEEKLSKAREIAEITGTTISQFSAVATEIDREVTYYERKLQDLYKERDNIPNGMATCPFCYQDIDEAVLASIQEEVEQKIAKTVKTWEGLKEKEKQVGSEINTYSTLKVKIDGMVTKFSDELKTLDGLKRSVEAKENALYRLRLDKQALENEKEAHTNTAKESMTKSENSPFLKMMDDCDKEIAEAKEKIKTKLAEQTIHEEEKSYYGLVSRAFDKDGIPKLVSMDALSVINKLIKRYTTRILGPKFKLELKAKPRGKSEEIYPDIDNPEGGLTYARQSGGERKDIDLCQQFALREFARMQDKSNFNVEFFDEVFAELDNYTSELFLDLIFEGETDNIFIITHKDMCKEYFKNKITVKKKGSTSTVHVSYAGVNEDSSETLEVAN